MSDQMQIYTTMGTSNTSFTGQVRSRMLHGHLGWWGVLDAACHRLRIPRKLVRPICDRYEISVGIPRRDLIEIDYTLQGKSTPWWLKR